MKIALFVVFMVSAPAHADWWTDDTERNALMLASNTALVVDWLQTRDIAVRDDHGETNSILGREPSTRDVNLYFGTYLIVHNLLGSVLPDRWAKMYYGGVFLIHMDAVRHNYRVGVRLRF